MIKIDRSNNTRKDHDNRRSFAWPLLCGLALACAVTVDYVNGVLIPIIGLYLVIFAEKEPEASPKISLGISFGVSFRHIFVARDLQLSEFWERDRKFRTTVSSQFVPPRKFQFPG